LGYEIIASNNDLPAIFDALLANPLVKPAGLGARDSLRLEMGYPLHGDDISPSTTPVEAGLAGFIGRTSGFRGEEALAAAKAHGPKALLCSFRSASRRKAVAGDSCVMGVSPMRHPGVPPGIEKADSSPHLDTPNSEAVIGKVTSAGFSPSLEISIGLGYVRTDLSKPGIQLIIRTARGDLPVEIAAKPLYKEGTFRKKPERVTRNA
jgi:aminomethyltransferase